MLWMWRSEHCLSLILARHLARTMTCTLSMRPMPNWCLIVYANVFMQNIAGWHMPVMGWSITYNYGMHESCEI